MFKKIISIIFNAIMMLFIVSCGSSSSSGGKNTDYTTSWIGSNAVELTLLNKKNNETIGLIIKKADQSAPTYDEVKDKVGFLTREIESNKSKKIYTAMHFDTNNNIKNDENLSWSDMLQADTKYKAYIFNVENKKIVKTVEFSTKTAPSKEEMRHVRTNGDHKITLTGSFPIEKKDGNDTYILHVKVGESALIPIYLNANEINASITIKNGGDLLTQCGKVQNDCFSFDDDKYQILGKEYLLATDSTEYGHNVYGVELFHIIKLDATNHIAKEWNLEDSSEMGGEEFHLTEE